MKAKPFLQGAGIATLYILPIAEHFLDPGLNEAISPPASDIQRASRHARDDAAGLAGGLDGISRDRAHLPERWRNLASVALAIFFIGLLIRVLMFVASAELQMGSGAVCSLLSTDSWFPSCFLSVCGSGRDFSRDAPRRRRHSAALPDLECWFLSRALLFMAFVWSRGSRDSFNRNALPVSHANSRIVWILMDELSYDQTFDHRPPDLSLPNFDAFAKQSVSFSDLQPTGFYTEDVVPALLIGATVRELKTPFNGQISIREVSGGAWQPLDQQSTIFAEAWKLGWNPGVAGWYNPYCRLFPDVLARCSWGFSDEVRRRCASLI